MLKWRLLRLVASARWKSRIEWVLGHVLDRTAARRRQAAEALLAAKPMPVPETVEELKSELRAGRGG